MGSVLVILVCIGGVVFLATRFVDRTTNRNMVRLGKVLLLVLFVMILAAVLRHK